MSERVRLDVWSDYVCPFCYLELPVLEALAREYGERLEVHWRAFELRPHPVPMLDPKGEYLRTTWERAVYPLAAERGLKLVLPPVQPRSRLAHEAAAFARQHGRFPELHQALFRAFFEQGEDIGQPEVLLRLAEESGLERQALEQALAEGVYTARVREDQATAGELGLTGVPALVFTPVGHPEAGGFLLTGAQPGERVRLGIERVLAGVGPDTARA